MENTAYQLLAWQIAYFYTFVDRADSWKLLVRREYITLHSYQLFLAGCVFINLSRYRLVAINKWCLPMTFH